MTSPALTVTFLGWSPNPPDTMQVASGRDWAQSMGLEGYRHQIQQSVTIRVTFHGS